MKVIYENKVKGLGAFVDAFKDEKLFIVFGDNAPDELKDYTYHISVNPINGTITAGQYLQVDDKEYKILAVGEEAPMTLAGLGHCSFRFNGLDTVEMPGSINVEDKEMPDVKVGSVLRIVEK